MPDGALFHLPSDVSVLASFRAGAFAIPRNFSQDHVTCPSYEIWQRSEQGQLMESLLHGHV